MISLRASSGLVAKAARLVTLKPPLCGASRTLSSSSVNWVETSFDEDTGIAILTLNRPPANSLSMEMCQTISTSIKELEANDKAQGLDLTELYKPDPSRLPKFWESFQQLYIDLYGSRMATIAAMNGHAPAAGCMLALSCDYRIMSAGNIGLNESKLGICAPPWLGQQFIDTIGLRQAELALALGTLFDINEAHKHGLIDEIATSDKLLEVAKERAAEWVAIPAQARVASKELTRGRQLRELEMNRQEDVDHFCSFVTQEAMQRNLGFYLKQLAKRKK
eukprot:scaffold7316_cov123-Cylindrotheca_fusiformis.AAC.17